jgi:hypothetical protein
MTQRYVDQQQKTVIVAGQRSFCSHGSLKPKFKTICFENTRGKRKTAKRTGTDLRNYLVVINVYVCVCVYAGCSVGWRGDDGEDFGAQLHRFDLANRVERGPYVTDPSTSPVGRGQETRGPCSRATQ